MFINGFQYLGLILKSDTFIRIIYHYSHVLYHVYIIHINIYIYIQQPIYVYRSNEYILYSPLIYSFLKHFMDCL